MISDDRELMHSRSGSSSTVQSNRAPCHWRRACVSNAGHLLLRLDGQSSAEQVVNLRARTRQLKAN